MSGLYVEVPFSGTKYVRVAQVADDQGELEDVFDDMGQESGHFLVTSSRTLKVVIRYIPGPRATLCRYARVNRLWFQEAIHLFFGAI